VPARPLDERALRPAAVQPLDGFPARLFHHGVVAHQIAELPRRDELKFEQVLLGQQIILDRLKTLEESLNGKS